MDRIFRGRYWLVAPFHLVVLAKEDSAVEGDILAVVVPREDDFRNANRCEAICEAVKKTGEILVAHLLNYSPPSRISLHQEIAAMA